MSEKASVLCWHTTHCTCQMEITYISIKAKLGIRVIQFVKNLIGCKVAVTGSVSGMSLYIRETETSYRLIRSPY